jgi:hypothetical protein
MSTREIRKLLSPALVAALIVSQTVEAQTQAIIGAPSPIPSDRIVIKDGTDVKLKFIEPLSSKTAHVGDPVTLELAEDLRVNDVVAVREGARATGNVGGDADCKRREQIGGQRSAGASARSVSVSAKDA